MNISGGVDAFKNGSNICRSTKEPNNLSVHCMITCYRYWLAQILVIARASQTLILNRPSDLRVDLWIRPWIPNTIERPTFISANCRIELPFLRQLSEVDVLRLVSFFSLVESAFISRRNNRYGSKTRLSTRIVLVTTLYSPFLGVLHGITKKRERDKIKEWNRKWINKGKGAGEQGGRSPVSEKTKIPAKPRGCSL